MASLENLTDGELRTQLTKFGYPVGPVTNTTRKLLLKKLKVLIDESNSSAEKKRPKNRARFSSDDESEDDAKPGARRRIMPPPKKTPPVKATKRRSSGRSSNADHNETGSTASPVSNSPGNGHFNASLQSNKISPTFPNSSRVSGSSLFGSLSGRQSIRSDLDSSTNTFTKPINYDTCSDTDVNEPDASSTKVGSTSFFNQLRFGRNSDRSRSLGFASGSTTSYLPADSFKRGFPNSNSSHEDLSTKLGNDVFDNYSDSNRRLTRPNQSSNFVSRLGNSLTTSTLGLSNVKESDVDEEPLKSSVSQSQFNARLRSNRWTFDSPWWRNTTIVSMGLVTFFICFFALIFISYINVKWKDTSLATPDVKIPTCKRDIGKPGVNCIVEDDKRMMMDIFEKIYQELHDHVVRVKCERSKLGESLTFSDLAQLIVEKYSDISVWEIEHQYGNLKVLIDANKQWGIVIDDKTLSISEPSLPFTCLIKQNVIYFIWITFTTVIAGSVLYISVRGFNWWMRRKEQHQKLVFNLVEAILDLLQTHSQNSGGDSFLAVDHVRDQLIPLHQRYSMDKLWEDAVAYLEDKESRVRSEIQQVAGEDCHVWRWLPTNNRRKMWQGQAFETQEGSVNSLNFSPTPCLKIRQMFDPDVEVGDEWMVHVKNAILEKCEGTNVLHIAIDQNSSEGCVFLKCTSSEEAGKAYRALHGSWFDNKLVTVKYLRLERYHERFPDAIRCTKPLRPSNNHKMSLQ